MTVKRNNTSQNDILWHFKYSIELPIRFIDFDVFGHVNNAVYLTYFEIARSAYWNEVIEWNWDEMGIILAKAEINYLNPIVLNDRIRAYVRTSEVKTTSFILEYALVKIQDEKEILCTTGSTVCVSFDYKTSQKAPIPDYQRSKMLEFEALV